MCGWSKSLVHIRWNNRPPHIFADREPMKVLETRLADLSLQMPTSNKEKVLHKRRDKLCRPTLPGGRFRQTAMSIRGVRSIGAHAFGWIVSQLNAAPLSNHLDAEREEGIIHNETYYSWIQQQSEQFALVVERLKKGINRRGNGWTPPTQYAYQVQLYSGTMYRRTKMRVPSCITPSPYTKASPVSSWPKSF
jgi:hypothetical protein